MARILIPAGNVLRVVPALLFSWVAFRAQAQAQVKVVAEPPSVVSFGICRLTATQAAGTEARWEWTVLTPDGGSFTRRGRSGPRNLYQAPRVATPRNVRLGVRAQGSEAPWNEAEVTVLPAGALVGRVSLPSRRVDYEPVTLHSGRTCALLATLTDQPDAPGVWAWSILEPQGGAFTRLRTGPRNVYQAPFLLAKRTFHVEVRGPGGASGRLPVTVLPMPQRHPTGNLLTGEVLSGSLGEDWALPALTRVGTSLPPAPGQAWVAEALCFVAGEGFWLVGDRQGVCKVDIQGRVTPMVLKGRYALEGKGPQDCSRLGCEGLASRPPGSGEGVPPVIALFRGPDPCGSHGPEGDWLGHQHLCSLDLDGTLTPLAGRCAGAAGNGLEGPAGEVDLRHVSGLALDAGGEVFLVDSEAWRVGGFLGLGRYASGGARRLGLDGVVRSLVDPVTGFAELSARDTMGLPILRQPTGLARAEATGELFTCEGNAIKRITPGGRTSVLFGCAWVEGAPAPRGTRMQDGPATPCLNGPTALCFHQGALYIADNLNRAVQVYTLATRTLVTLVGEPGKDEPRPGPLATFAPHLLPEECAVLGVPRNVCLNAEGTLALVALDRGVVRVELGEGDAKGETPGPEPVPLP
jgi:hypothetical protein